MSLINLSGLSGFSKIRIGEPTPASAFFEEELDPSILILTSLSYKDTIAFCQTRKSASQYCEDFQIWYNKAKERVSDGVNPEKLKEAVRSGEKPSVSYHLLMLKMGIVDPVTDEINNFNENQFRVLAGGALLDDNLKLVEWILRKDPSLEYTNDVFDLALLLNTERGKKYIATMLYFVGKAGLTDYVNQIMDISKSEIGIRDDDDLDFEPVNNDIEFAKMLLIAFAENNMIDNVELLLSNPDINTRSENIINYMKVLNDPDEIIVVDQIPSEFKPNIIPVNTVNFFKSARGIEDILPYITGVRHGGTNVSSEAVIGKLLTFYISRNNLIGKATVNLGKPAAEWDLTRFGADELMKTFFGQNFSVLLEDDRRNGVTDDVISTVDNYSFNDIRRLILSIMPPLETYHIETQEGWRLFLEIPFDNLLFRYMALNSTVNRGNYNRNILGLNPSYPPPFGVKAAREQGILIADGSRLVEKMDDIMPVNAPFTFFVTVTEEINLLRLFR